MRKLRLTSPRGRRLGARWNVMVRAKAAPHLPAVDDRAVFRSLRAMAEEFDEFIHYR